MNFYVSIFENAKISSVSRYPEDSPGDAGTVMTVAFELDGQAFVALNGGPHFAFTPAVSFAIDCATQAEVDRFWERLCEGGRPSQCGWLQDRYGLSWQVVPTMLPEVMESGDEAKSNAVMQAMLQMTKPDIAALQQAYDGRSTAGVRASRPCGRSQSPLTVARRASRARVLPSTLAPPLHAEALQHVVGGGVGVEVVGQRRDDVLDAALERAEREIAHAVREGDAALGADRAALAQPGVVRDDRVPQLGDALAFERLGADQRRNPAREVEHLHHRADLALQLQRHRVVGLVDHEHVGDLEHAGLEHLHRVAAAGLQRDQRRVGDLGDLDLALADADRLDQHHVLAEGVHQRDRVGGRAGDPAQVPARGHRANEDVGVDEVLGQSRMRSPSSAPCEKGELGSTEITPTVLPSRRACATSAPARVDLPTPGGPVSPIVSARPVSG